MAFSNDPFKFKDKDGINREKIADAVNSVLKHLEEKGLTISEAAAALDIARRLVG